MKLKKNDNNKKSLNDNLITIIIITSWLLIITSLFLSLIVWKKTSDVVLAISGVLCALGLLFNIYLWSRVKAKI